MTEEVDDALSRLVNKCNPEKKEYKKIKINLYFFHYYY
uniref:Uncharacterized protein n=1 Tax=viral metagenome TaxID=1070528 RepID=A0A6C0EZU2_9ZZZZ